jgi:phage recombination protein Bet
MTQAIERTERQLPRVPSDAEVRQWANVVEMTGYTLAEISMLRGMQGKDPAPPVEMAQFLLAAKALDLNPLIRECYWIRRSGKGAMQVGIDGFRKRASKTREYAGSDEAIFRGVVELKVENETIRVPEQASVVVWRIVQGRKCAFTGTARWSEFYPGSGTNGQMYRTKPYLMLAKDAEAQALRKGFSDAMAAMPITAVVDEESNEITEQAPVPRRALTAADYDRAHAGETESMTGVTPPSAREQLEDLEELEPGDLGEQVDLAQADSSIGKAFARAMHVAREKHLDVDDLEMELPADREDVVRRTERVWDRVAIATAAREKVATAQELDAQVEADSGLESIP